MVDLLFFTAIAFAAPKCLSEIDLKTEVCWALCRQDGYDSGAYKLKTKSCYCANEIEYRVLSEPRLILPKAVTSSKPKSSYEDESFQIIFK